jgi:hypothetical protein
MVNPLLEISTVSEQQPEQTSGETGSLSASPAVSPAAAPSSDAPATVSAASGAEAPGQGAASEALRADASKDAPKIDAPKVEATKTDAPRSDSKVLIMSPADRTWDGGGAGAEAESGSKTSMFGKRRFGAMAAMVALAALAGALGGALATSGLGHVAGDTTPAANQALEATVARIDADILALKASVEHTSKTAIGQFNKTSDRLDKVEKAQAEPLAKLAKLSEAVDKLRATPPAVPTPVAAAPAATKEVTGSVAPPAVAAAAPTASVAPKTEVARLPTVEGWVLRDVGQGGALIESRRGVYEVYPGDAIPGLGRIDAVRRQDGRWVVITSKGLIAAR